MANQCKYIINSASLESNFQVEMKLDVSCMRYLGKDEYRYCFLLLTDALVICLSLPTTTVQQRSSLTTSILLLYRVLTAVEMGMRNHDLVPVDLIMSIAKLRSGMNESFLFTSSIVMSHSYSLLLCHVCRWST